MSVDTQLERAVADLQAAFTAEPRPLPDKPGKRAMLTAVFVAVVLAAGLLGYSSLRQDKGASGNLDAVTSSEADQAADTTTITTAEIATPSSPTTRPTTVEETSGVEAADRLFALASPPPPGIVFDRGTSVTDSQFGADVACSGCTSLEVRRSRWLPIGPQDLITISLHRSLYRNPAGAEELTIRGQEATLDSDGFQQTLVWDEAQGLTAVVTARGYERVELLAVAEALTIDSDSLAVEATVVPEASTAVAAEDLARPKLLLQYRSDDDATVTVQVYETNLELTADRRAALQAVVETAGLNSQLPQDQVRYLESDDGVGVFFIGHDRSVVQFWTSEGLVLLLSGEAEKVGEEALTGLAASFRTVSAAEWQTAGGQ